MDDVQQQVKDSEVVETLRTNNLTQQFSKVVALILDDLITSQAKILADLTKAQADILAELTRKQAAILSEITKAHSEGISSVPHTVPKSS